MSDEILKMLIMKRDKAQACLNTARTDLASIGREYESLQNKVISLETEVETYNELIEDVGSIEDHEGPAVFGG